MLIQLTYAALRGIRIGRWPLYQLEAGEVKRVTAQPQHRQSGDVIFELTPTVSLSTFKEHYPESIEVINMSFINASEAATTVTANIPNAPTFTVQQETVAVANTPVQAAALAVPNNHGVTVQNSPTNPANAILFVANSSANALLASARVQLSRSQSVVLHVDNLDDIWINSPSAGVTATLVVEA